MKKVLYFSHDSNAMGDNKIDDLRALYGMEGYGVFWAIVEALSREADLKLPKTQRKADSLKNAINPSFDVLKFINDCVEIGLFKTDGEFFWSDSLIARLSNVVDISQKRREAALKRWAGKGKPKETDHAMPRPEEMDAFVNTIDPEWRKVAEAYEREIGLLPTGQAREEFQGFYDDLGSGPIVAAIKKVNRVQPSNKYTYLRKMLQRFVEHGVHTEDDAIEFMDRLDSERKKWQENKNNQRNDDNEEIRWIHVEPVHEH